MKSIAINPFGINNYLGPDLFCNRQVETKQLMENVYNQRNCAFFALRRLGKTSLIKHLFYQFNKTNVQCLYLDIYATQNLKEMGNELAKTIYQAFPEKKGIGNKFLQFIKSFQPVLTIDSLTGSPELSLDVTQQTQIEKTIPQLLHFLDKQETQIVIAIDEFQQILNFPEKNVEAILRTSIQELKNITFIFCGSNQAMMHEIFNNVKRPFYASCTSLNLQKINTNDYFEFIDSIMKKYKKNILPDAVEYILEYTQGYTYYTQRLCNMVFQLSKNTIEIELVQKAIFQLLNEMEGTFYQYRNLLTPTQWKLLQALAKEEKVEQVYSNTFIYKYNLGSAAMVKRSLDALLTKEMVYKNTLIDAPFYAVYDVFLMRWLQRM